MEEQQSRGTGDDDRGSGTAPSTETHEAERAEAEVHGGADRQPTPQEEEVTEDEPAVTDEGRRHAEEMLDLGVNQKGEGRIA